MNSVTLIGTVRAPLGESSFVLAVKRNHSQSDLVPINSAVRPAEGERVAIEGALRVRGGAVEVEASALHRLSVPT